MSDSNINGANNQNDENDNVAVRILITGPEILGLVNNFGEVLRQIRKESGAKINISEGSVKDRIVSITGSHDSLYKAVRIITECFEKFLMYSEKRDSRKNPFTLKLMVPAAQCGPLIGKGGSKIRELRELTGAVIQVAMDVLPNSAERVVNISGKVESITECIMQIATIICTKISVGLYQPWIDEVKGPILFSEGKVYTLQGTLAIPVDNDFYNRLMNNPKVREYINSFSNNDNNRQFIPGDHQQQNPESSSSNGTVNINRNEDYVTDVLWINNDLIGCIMGQDGSRIEEIRQITGASVVRIINEQEETTAAEENRTKISVQGTHESVTLAKFLISLCMELEIILAQRGRAESGPLSVASMPVLDSLAKSGITVVNNLPKITKNNTINEVVNLLGISGLFGPA